MFQLEGVSITTQDLLVLVSVGFIIVAFAIWQLFYVRGRGASDDTLTDGAVLLISDGVVQQASGSARQMLGECENQTIIRLLDGFLGPDATEARDAVNRLEMTGDPVEMLVHDVNGSAFELIGRPSGAMIKLILRDAELLDNKLKDAEDRVNAADTALKQHQWEQETLNGLITEAPIIAWHRTAEGEVNWSGGEIKVRNSSISAAQAVDLIVARTRLNRMPVLAGQPQKSRIEIVVNEGADTVSLHVLEIIRQDGSRIGFATDAGTAASAERTLTRFVQTMTETFAHLTVGLAIFDRNQTLALFNPALVQMWQVEPAWLARRPSLRDIIDELRSTRRLPELQDFHKWRSRIVGLFENTEAADYEELWHLADGSNIRVLARPHPHGSLAFIFDDVTERVRLEQRYRHSIDLRRATLDRLNEGVAVFGANGLLQFVNQAFHEIWGTDGETIYAAMHARQLVGLCDQLTIDADLWHRLHSFVTGEESRRSWSETITMGSGRQLLARVAPLPDGSTMAVFSDAEHALPAPGLAAPDASLDATAATVRAGLDAATELLPASAADDEQRAAIEQAREAFARMFGRDDASADNAASNGYRYDVADALQRTANILKIQAREHGVTLSIDPEMVPTLVLCEQIGLRQMLYNLTGGAILAVGQGGSLVLGADGSDESFQIHLRATGANIDTDSLQNSTSLEIAKRFAARDGGEIVVETGSEPSLFRAICTFQTRSNTSNGPSSNDHYKTNIHSLTPKAAG